LTVRADVVTPVRVNVRRLVGDGEPRTAVGRVATTATEGRVTAVAKAVVAASRAARKVSRRPVAFFMQAG
jgi:hypothetical protein